MKPVSAKSKQRIYQGLSKEGNLHFMSKCILLFQTHHFKKVPEDMTIYNHASQKLHSKNSIIKLVAVGITVGI